MRDDCFVLTGCASGIGRHLAGELLSRGHRVFATDLNEAGLRSAAREWPADRTLLRALDVRDPEAWGAVTTAAFEAWGRIDVVMNIAGFLHPARVHEVTDREVDLTFDVNVKGVVYGTRAAARIMVPQRRGHIINIASMAALAPVPGLALYCASKYAVRGFSLSAAGDLRPHGVSVTVVCPDAVRTPMLDLQKGYEEAALTFSGRVLTVEDVAQTVLNRVLKRRPLEVAIPRSRELLARAANLAPGLGLRLAPALSRKGQKAQKSY